MAYRRRNKWTNNRKRDEARSESEEELWIMALLIALGAKVYKLSQKRVSGQTTGIADLFAFVPVRSGVVPLWIEVKKTVGGVVSPQQEIFRMLCKLSSMPHVLGGFDDVAQWAKNKGLLSFEGEWWRIALTEVGWPALEEQLDHFEVMLGEGLAGHLFKGDKASAARKLAKKMVLPLSSSDLAGE